MLAGLRRRFTSFVEKLDSGEIPVLTDWLTIPIDDERHHEEKKIPTKTPSPTIVDN
jgi:hypothetical protein